MCVRAPIYAVVCIALHVSGRVLASGSSWMSLPDVPCMCRDMELTTASTHVCAMLVLTGTWVRPRDARCFRSEGRCAG